MRTTHDELEERLTTLFREQAASVPVASADWAELRPVAGAAPRSPRRFVLAAAAVLAAVLAAVVAGGDADPARVRTGPADGSGTPSPTTTAPAPFRVATRQVALSADALAIDAGGERFVAAAVVSVNGDPGVPDEYTTLELTWEEHGVEMRLFVYFRSDGRDWWSDEIRTYDGRPEGGWITYRGEFFRRPLGAPFVGDVDLRSTDPVGGRLRLTNARVDAFIRPSSCTAATTALVIEPGTSPVVMEGVLSGYGVNVHLLEAASCSVVPDQDRYRYAWESRDTSVVSLDAGLQPPGPGGRNAQLRPEGRGRTVLHVTATDPDTGAVVAEADIPVVVGDVMRMPPGTLTPAPATAASQPQPPAPTAEAPTAESSTAAGPGPVLRSAVADLDAGTITVTFDQPVNLGPAALAAMYLVVYGDQATCDSPAGNSHEVLSGAGTATLTLDATSLARPTTYIRLAPGFVTGVATGAPSPPLGCTPVPTS